tara:strand:- start:1619 stop:6985 length:5367 start_codon:yes stop_codon:yes gene_type:complete
MTTSGNCEKKIVKFNPRESALPHWSFKGHWPSPIPDSKRMDLYEKCAEDCTPRLRWKIQDLPEGLKEFASYERVSMFHDLRRRQNFETDKDYEDKRKRGRLHFDFAPGNDDDDDGGGDPAVVVGEEQLGGGQGDEWQGDYTVPLAITVPVSVTMGAVAPQKGVDFGHHLLNSHVVEFQIFQDLAKAFCNNDLVRDEVYLEAIYDFGFGSVAAWRFALVVKGLSSELDSIFQQDDEEAEDEEDEGAEAAESGGEEGEACVGTPFSPSFDEGSPYSEERNRIVHKLQWATNFVAERYIKTGSTDKIFASKAVKKQKRQQRGVGSGNYRRHRAENQEWNRKEALRRWRIAAEALDVTEQGQTADPILNSHTLEMRKIVHEKQKQAPVYAATKVFGMHTCLWRDSFRQDPVATAEVSGLEQTRAMLLERRIGPHDNEAWKKELEHLEELLATAREKAMHTGYDPMQTEAFHYIQDAVDVHKLVKLEYPPDWCRGITFPPMSRQNAQRFVKYGITTAAMCISKEHFIEGDWENLMNPLDAYLEHLENLRAKATGAQRTMNPRQCIMFSAGGDDALGTMAEANRGLFAKAANGGASIAFLPAERRDGDTMRRLLQPEEDMDEELRRQRWRLENPRSVVDDMKETPDARNFLKDDEELGIRLSKVLAASNGDLASVDTDELEWLVLTIDALEGRAEALSATLVRQARVLARNADRQLLGLSAAQAAVLKEPLLKTDEEYCMGEKGFNPQLSDLANLFMDYVRYYEYIKGVFTGHDIALKCHVSLRTGIIPDDGLKFNLIFDGEGGIGKNFIAAIVESVFGEPIFRECGQSTEASEIDPDRQLQRGGCNLYPETPVCLNENHPRFYNEVQSKKAELTENRVKRRRNQLLHRADGSDKLMVCNICMRTNGVMWVLTNDEMSVFSKFGVVNKSKQAMMTRFDHLQMPASARETVSALYETKQDGVINAVAMAEKKHKHNMWQNLRFHHIVGMLIGLGTVKMPDRTVFDAVTSEVVRKHREKGIAVSERMKRRAWTATYVLSLEAWWAQKFMRKGTGNGGDLRGGSFVNRRDSGLPPSQEVCIKQLTRLLRVDPLLITEEHTLFAWQMLQNSGSASQSVMNHIALIIEHMVENALVTEGPETLRQGRGAFSEPTSEYDRVMRFLQPPKAPAVAFSDGDGFNFDDDAPAVADSDECGAKTYEYIYIHVPPQSGGGAGDSQHLKRVCDMLVTYNQRHCVVDKNHSCSVIMDTLKKWQDRADSVVPVEYEFRKLSAKTGEQDHIFAPDNADLLWACFEKNMAVTDELMRLLAIEPIVIEVATAERSKRTQVLRLFGEHSTFDNFAKALRKKLKDTLSAGVVASGRRSFYSLWKAAMRLVEAIRDADETNFIVKADQPDAAKRRAFAKAARETRDFEKKKKKKEKKRKNKQKRRKQQQRQSQRQEDANEDDEVQEEQDDEEDDEDDALLYPTLTAMPVPVLFQWQIVHERQLQEDEYGNRDESDVFATVATTTGGNCTSKLKPAAEHYLRAMERNFGNARHDCDGLEEGDDEEDEEDDEEEEEEEDVGILGVSGARSGRRNKAFRRPIEIVQHQQAAALPTDRSSGAFSRYGGHHHQEQQKQNQEPPSYVRIDIQAVLAWASAARTGADRSEVVHDYAHAKVKEREVLLYQMTKDYDRLGVMQLKRKPSKTLKILNPLHCPEKVSSALVTTADAALQSEWARQPRYIFPSEPLDELAHRRIVETGRVNVALRIAKELRSRADRGLLPPDSISAAAITDESLRRRQEHAALAGLGAPYRYLTHI